MFIVYKATHNPTQKVYVGQTKNTLEVRMGQHFSEQRRTTPFGLFLKTTKMQEWTWETLHTFNTRKEAIQCELYYIDKWNLYEVGLNTKTGYQVGGQVAKAAAERFVKYKQVNKDPWNKGVKGCFSEETREAMRLSKLLKPTRVVYTPEMKAKKSLEATNSKKIIELKSGIIYNSISDAARKLGLRREAVRDVVKGRRSHTAGYVFVVFDENNVHHILNKGDKSE